MINHPRALLSIVLAAVLLSPTRALSNEKAARKLAERAFEGKRIEAIRRMPGLPFYEIWIDRTLVYTDLNAKVLILGNMLDGATLTNLRQTRVNELMAVPFKDLPLDQAIKTVRGRGENILVVFADPNCGYCKQFEAELRLLQNVTIYTVMYPVLSPDSRDKAIAVLCAAQPEQAWRAWMDEGRLPPAPLASCQPALDQAIDQALTFGREHDIGITPTTFLKDGRRLAGFMPSATLGKELATVKR